MEMDRIEVAGDAPPADPPKGHYVRILVATHKAPAKLIVGHRMAIGRYVHWVRRGLLCATPGEVCVCKLQPYPRRWYAYLAGWDVKDGRRAVLQIPWHSWRTHSWRHDTKDPDHLLGLTVTVSRATAHPKSPVEIVCNNVRHRLSGGPLSYQEAVQRLEWAYDHLAPDFDNQESFS